MLRRLSQVGLVLAVLLGSLALARPATAQTSARVIMTTDRATLDVGQTLRLQIRAEVTGGTIDSFDVPDLSAFEIRQQRVTQPTSIRFGFGNQQVVQQSTTIYDYVLAPTRPGRFELPPTQIQAGGQIYRSNPLTIVVGGTAGQGTPPPSSNPAATTPVDPAQIDDTAFVRTVTDKDRPYVGEQMTVSVYLYTRAPIRSAPQVTRNPSADGFWVHDLLPAQRTLESRTRSFNGTRYHEYLIKQFAAFPLREGELVIEAPTMQITTGAIFDLFRGPQNIARTGQPVTVRARALPPPPANTHQTPAVVGRYQIEARLDRNAVRTGDAATVTATVRGEGNIRDATLALPPVDGLRILQPRSEERIEQPNNRVGGERRFEWLIVPERPGEYLLPRLALNVFDPTTAQYQLVQAPPLTLTAAGNALPSSDPEPSVAEPSPPEPEANAASFGPIRTHSSLRKGGAPLSSHGWYLAVLFGIPALFVMLLGGQAFVARRRSLARSTSQTAQHRLQAAEQHANKADAKAFYSAVAQALKGAIEGRLGEPVGGLTHDPTTPTHDGSRDAPGPCTPPH